MVSLASKPFYTLKITLAGTEPPVWRRLVVLGDLRLDELHEIFQYAMGWTNSHMHSFNVGKRQYGITDPGFGDAMLDECDFALEDIAPRKGAKFQYEYDFGDSWLHEVKVESIEQVNPGHAHPVCTAGEGQCPPEDCGGIWGYRELLDAMEDPKHERHEEFMDWFGGPFDANAFNLKKVNAVFKKMKYT